MTSINYYNDNDQEYINRTFDLDMSPLADEFLDLVGDHGTLLDLGCGSGRDAVYFKSRGYDVYAMDGSEAMVKHAKEKLGDRVNWSTFEDYKTNVLFDGIWACASLLHVPRQEMNKILVKYRDLLKPDGVYQLELKLILNI